MMNEKKHIVVLDDDADICRMIEIMLQYRGYSVSSLTQAQQISKTISEHRPDLIIMDMLLSGQYGTDICSSLKSDPETKNICVIMMSAHPNAKEVCLRAGADEFLPKPFNFVDLMSKVDQLLPSTIPHS